jgi:hypothetical protein
LKRKFQETKKEMLYHRQDHWEVEQHLAEEL